MKKTTKLRYYIESLCIYCVQDDKVISALFNLLNSTDSEEVLQNQGVFFNALSAHTSLKHYVSKLVLTHDNVFTKACANGTQNQLPQSVIDGVTSDLKKLEAISAVTVQDILDAVEDEDIKEILWTMPRWETGTALLPLTYDWNEQLDDLAKFHKQNGYGVFARHIAFHWRDGKIQPISSVNKITLGDLKNYHSQRDKVVENTVAFLQGLPANNVLLYGDRGTGKSSTVQAILNEYKNQGLRMVEISKGDINELSLIREKLSQSPMKFIIFIDDLSFEAHDDSFGELKAALEGSLSSGNSNIIIYATSNRRHLIKENFSDRENDINRADSMQEAISLSDRFGLFVTFLNPNKDDYLDIVEKIVADRDFDVDIEKLKFAAERWATQRGGRSPRCAKQFIDYVEGCVKQGKDW